MAVGEADVAVGVGVAGGDAVVVVGDVVTAAGVVVGVAVVGDVDVTVEDVTVEDVGGAVGGATSVGVAGTAAVRLRGAGAPDGDPVYGSVAHAGSTNAHTRTATSRRPCRPPMATPSDRGVPAGVGTYLDRISSDPVRSPSRAKKTLIVRKENTENSDSLDLGRVEAVVRCHPLVLTGSAAGQGDGSGVPPEGVRG